MVGFLCSAGPGGSRFFLEKIMMRKNEKVALKDEVVEKIKSSKALVFADYKGVTVKEIERVRKSLRETGSRWQILKKSILNVALSEVGIPVNARKLDGQVGVAFSSDEVAAAKVIAQHVKENKDTKLSIVGGSLEMKALSVEEVRALAKLPSRDELRATLAGTLQASVAGFVRTLSGTYGGFVRVLNAVAESKK